MLLDAVSSYPYVQFTCREIHMYFTRAFATTLDGALSPLVGAGYVLLSLQFDVSVDEVASSFGALLLGLGCFM